MRIHSYHIGSRARRGVAAVEMAMVAPLLMSLLLGLWEVGRYVMVQDVLDSAAREGARLSASGGYFASSNFNSATTSGETISLASPPSTNTSFEVQRKVKLYLSAMGITTTGMTVTVTNSTRTWTYTWTDDGTTNGSGTGSGYDPAAAATQLDQLSVTVTLPYKNVAYSPLSIFISQSATLSASASWLSLADIPLTVSTTIPSQPIGPNDALP
jgi:Flp pilus assembly protein TadG